MRCEEGQRPCLRVDQAQGPDQREAQVVGTRDHQHDTTEAGSASPKHSPVSEAFYRNEPQTLEERNPETRKTESLRSSLLWPEECAALAAVSFNDLLN